MKKLVFLLLAAALCFPSSLMAGLQEDNLINNVLIRFQGIISERGGDPWAISRESLVVEQSIPFEVDVSGQRLTMYAVRVVLSGPEPGQKQNVTLIVDETGGIQLDGAFADLSTGKSIHQDVLDELERMESDPGVGDLLFTGSGQASVLYLSDPFCPYCRHAYTYLRDQKDRISEFKIAHFPINPNSGAVALTLIMMDFKGEDNYQDVVDFAYNVDPTGLTGNADHSVIRLFNNEFQIFTRTSEDVFDYLQEKHQNNLAREMEKMRAMGLSGTPVIIINGIRVDGFNRDRINDLLNRAME